MTSVFKTKISQTIKYLGILIFTGILIVNFQNCNQGDHFVTTLNSKMTPEKDTLFSVRIEDSFNSQYLPLTDEHPEMVFNQPYELVVANKKGQAFTGKINWKIQSIPEGVCKLYPSTQDLKRASLFCSEKSNAVLEVGILQDPHSTVVEENHVFSLPVWDQKDLSQKGSLLFQKNCQSCHTQTLELQNKSAQDLVNNIFGSNASEKHSIQSLQILSPTELRAISGYLNESSANLSSGSSIQTKVTEQMGVAAASSTSSKKMKITMSSKSLAKNTLELLATNTMGPMANTTSLEMGYPRTPENVKKGENLWSANCKGCHSELKNDRPYLHLRKEIGGTSSVSSMKKIKLKDEEVYLIFLYLNPENGLGSLGSLDSEVTSTSEEQSKPLLGTRFFVASQMKQIFLDPSKSSDEEENYLKNIIESLLKNQFEALGGPCRKNDFSQIDTENFCMRLYDLSPQESPMLPNVNMMRRGYITRTCEEILSLDRSLTNALKKVNLTTKSKIDDKSLKLIFDLFHPGKVPSTEIISALNKIGNKSQLTSDNERWQGVMLTMCQSPLRDPL